MYLLAELKENGQCSSDQTQLTVDDLAKICEELYSIREKWRDVALQLGIPVDKLDHIKATHPDSADCLRETVKEWLTTSPAPTWQILTSALQSRTVNEHELAGRLKEKYCKSEGTSLLPLNCVVEALCASFPGSTPLPSNAQIVLGSEAPGEASA